MTNFLRIFLVSFLFFCCSITKGSEPSFPQRCEGTWKGTMEIWSNGNQVSSVSIQLLVQPVEGNAGQWVWRTSYFTEKDTMLKDYSLHVTASANTFLMDEGGGVYLTNYIFGNKMYSSFTVQKTWLTATYELLEDTLIFEVTSSAQSKQKSKGGVKNYEVQFMQRAVFSKIS